MPELPEAETIRKQLAPLIQGASVVTLSRGIFPGIFLVPPEDLSGWIVDEPKRTGKVLLFPMHSPGGDRGILVTRLGMSGHWSVRTRTHDTAMEPHTHLTILLEQKPSGETLLLTYQDPRRFGRLEWVKGKTTSVILENTGPDILLIDPASFHQSLRKSSRSIRTLLLDQTIASGIGNIYVSEILFLSGIHPDKKGTAITRKEAGQILAVSREILARAILSGGSSIHSFKNAYGEEGGHQNHLNVYGHGGEHCPRCQTLIVQKRSGGRTGYFCPRCQGRKKIPLTDNRPAEGSSQT